MVGLKVETIDTRRNRALGTRVVAGRRRLVGVLAHAGLRDAGRRDPVPALTQPLQTPVQGVIVRARDQIDDASEARSWATSGTLDSGQSPSQE